MTHRIMLADDSQTIHKVISYTFADKAFALDIAASMEEIEQKLTHNEYQIILLDFGLSGSMDGYELARQIGRKAPQSHLIMLFNSFDSVDEGQLKHARVVEKVIKPFESQYLLDLCEGILARPADGVDSMPPLIAESEEGGVLPSQSDSDGQDWKMEGSMKLEPPLLDEIQLKNNVQDWSIEVPPVIGEEVEEQSLIVAEDIPPVILEETAESQQLSGDIPAIEKVPSTEDLEYPSGERSKPQLPSLDCHEDIGDIPDPSPFGNMGGIELTPISDLSLDDNGDDDDDFDRATVVISTEDHEEKTVIIEESIKEEEHPELFWSLDGDENEESKQNLSNDPDFNIDDFVEKIKPVIEEAVQHYCKEIIEKVAWEVIPELAENIIKKELQSIKDSVIKE